MPIATVCKVRPPPPCLTPLLCPFPPTHQPTEPPSPADVACQCRHGFVGDGISTCNGKLLDVLATTANFSTFYGVCRGPGGSG